jgi:hypothetical protein
LGQISRQKLSKCTDGVTNSEAVKLGLSQPTPNLQLVDFIRVVETTVNRDDILHEHVDGVHVLFVFLIDRAGLFVETVICGNSGNFPFVIILQLVDITDDLSLVGAYGSEKQQVLKVPVVTEWRGFENNLLGQFNELNREVRRKECLDGEGNVIGIGALRNCTCDNLRAISYHEAQNVAVCWLVKRGCDVCERRDEQKWLTF